MVNPLIFLVLLAFSTVFGALDVIHEWKYIEYEWKNSQQKQNAIDSGDYILGRSYLVDVQPVPDGRIFVTTPRDPGVPATVSILTNKTGKGGPLLRPYLDWEWHTRTDCNGIWNVMRVALDECNQLYVLDTGVNISTHICPAQLLIFDLSNDSLIKRITIPQKYSANADGWSTLNNLVVETQVPHCERARVYISDVIGRGLVVWDGKNLRRYASETFDPVPQYGNVTIAGETTYMGDGIFSVALKPKKDDCEFRDLYYRPLASLNQYFVSTDQLRKPQPNYQTMNYTFPTQVTVETFSHDGIMFFGLAGTTAMGCWDSHKPMNDENVVTLVQNEETLQFMSAIKFRGEQMWVVTMRYQKIALKTLNLSDVNFRIFYEPNISHMVKGTKCQLRC